jgi:hypothetical protein
MVRLDDVARIALELPEVEEGLRHGNRTWFVKGKGFVWELGLSKADLKRWGDALPPPPDGPLVAVRTADLAEKEALLQRGTPGFFTITHFDGYPAVLVELQKVTTRPLRAAIVDAWLACAPMKLADAYVEEERAKRRRRSP